MGLCTCCGRMYCDHTAKERGQTDEEMMRDLSPEERKAWEEGNTQKQIEMARKHAHDPAQ